MIHRNLLVSNVIHRFASFLFVFAAHCVPVRREGLDQAHQDGADGHRADEGPRERPGDAGGPPVQLGQVLHQHPGAA